MISRVIIICGLLLLYLEHIAGNENVCQTGDHCRHCLPSEVVKDQGGNIFCCNNCNGIPVIEGDNCTCFNDEHLSQRIVFPDSPTSEREMHGNKDNYEVAPLMIQGPDPHTAKNQKELESLMNLPSILGALGISYNTDNSGIKRSIDLLAETMHRFDERLRAVEYRLRAAGPGVRFPGTANSVGHNFLVPSINFLKKTISCKGQFRKMGNICIYVSVWSNQRGNWKNADDICKGKGGKLIEITDHARFLELSKFLTSSSVTSGFSYWIGSINPGAIWLWMTSHQKVSLNSIYWKRGKDENGRYPSPGDMSHGRCLRFNYDTKYRSYYFQGMQCAKDSFFICQMTT